MKLEMIIFIVVNDKFWNFSHLCTA